MIHPIAFFLFCSCNSIYTNLQYSSLGTEVHRGRGKIPVADYKVASYVSREDGKTPSSSGPTSRSCYSFCMCPGGQVYLFVWIFCKEYRFECSYSFEHCLSVTSFVTFVASVNACLVLDWILDKFSLTWKFWIFASNYVLRDYKLSLLQSLVGVTGTTL
jgi:hypothetical protein